MDRVTVVVRSVGERTEKACLELLERQVPKDAIHLIHEYPFSQAVRRNFEIGLQEDRPWTMGLDADVLLFEGAVERLVGIAEQGPDKAFEFQGQIFDKWMSVTRKGGPHLFRTELLEKALSLIPQEGRSLRPESDVFLAMADEGYPYVHGKELYGLHDVGQYKKDIYRTVFVHARKNKKRARQMERIFKELKPKDDDYRIALKALKDGSNYRGEMSINAKSFEAIVEKGLKGEPEKDAGFQVSPMTGIESIPRGLLLPEALSITEKYPTYMDYSRKGAFKRAVKKLLSKGGLR